MRDINDLITLTSIRSNYPEAMVNSVLRFYYDDVRTKLQDKSCTYINLGGFGTLLFHYKHIGTYLRIKINFIEKTKLRLIDPNKVPTKTSKLILNEKITNITKDVDRSYELYTILKDKVKFLKTHEYRVHKAEAGLKKLLVIANENLLPKGLKDNPIQREYLQQLPE